MKKLITVLAIALSASSACADDDLYLYAGGFSKHFKDRKGNKDYNEIHNNIGLGYEASLDDVLGKEYYGGLNAQYMKNSVDNDSLLLTASLKRKWKLSLDSDIGLGMMVGAQTGYPKKGERGKGAFVPVAYPILEYNYQRFGVYGTCVPEVYSSGFCFAGFKVRVTPF